MSDNLTARSALDTETMWAAMRRLIERVFGVLDRETVFDDCLGIIVELLGADRGQVLIVDHDGTPRTVHAMSPGQRIDAGEREAISKALIRRALDKGECVTWDVTSLDVASSSIGALGIRAALAAPLHRPGATARRAVLYVDVRDPQKHLGHDHIEFFMAAAVLVGALVDERSRSEALHTRLVEALAHTTDIRKAPPLTELLEESSLDPVREDVLAAVRSELPMLILGESGTGKTLLAQAVADASGRRPVVRATLGSSDDLNTLTSELFGHERGSFSGASSRRVGLVEYAHGGTLILDELLNLPKHAQKLLLDFTQFGTYRPLGYDRQEPKRATVRIIGATNGDLRAAVRAGRFREDLYHRLAGIVVELPPLRRRRGELVHLAEKTLRRLDPDRDWTLSVDVRRLLASSSLEWTGNIRQLERVVARARERALLRDPQCMELVPEHFEARDLDGVAPRDALGAPTRTDASQETLASTWQRLQAERARIDEDEQALIRRAFGEGRSVVSQAARLLGIARTTLADRLDALGMRGKRDKDGEPVAGDG